MAANKKTRRRLGRALADLRASHAQLLGKVEKAKRKLEKRTRKLHALELEIANLERQYFEPDVARLGQADVSDRGLRRARLIYNPDSGANHGEEQLLADMVKHLRAHGIVAEIGIKTSGKAARQLAKEAAENDDPLVIVAGGDGTIEDVASQLIESRTALGIVPIGTMNNLARALGVPLELEEACALIGMGVTRRIDVGHVLANDKPDVEYFLETAGAGLSAIVIPAGQAAEKGRWAQLPDAVRKLFDAKPGPVTVQLDGQQVIQANSQVVTVSNAPLMGRNILIAPDAKMDDGLLDVAIYEEMSKTDLLGYVLAASNGTRADNPNVKFFRARHVRIQTTEPIEAHSDKDVVQPQEVITPASEEEARSNDRPAGQDEGVDQKQYVVEVEVIPGALSVIVGKGMALTLPVEAVAQGAVLPAPSSDGDEDKR